MGSAMAIREGSNPVPGTFETVDEMRSELREFARKLDVESHLQTYGTAVEVLSNSATGDEYYLLELNPSTKQISIQGYKNNELEKAAAHYLAVERQMPTGNDAVLVSLDSVTSLRRAYPNYFLDTHVFIDAVRDALGEAINPPSSDVLFQPPLF